LMYHRVADREFDDGRMAVVPERFSEQMEAIRQLFQPVPLHAVVEGLRTGRVSGGAVAVTFDDGYRDNLTEAKPVLEQFDVPARVCVVSGYVGSGRAFWWDELERICTAPGDLPGRLELKIGQRLRIWSVRTAEGRRPLYRALRESVWTLGEPEREEILDRLREWSGVEPATGDETMDVKELGQLADGGLVEIGAHSVTHPRLPGLSDPRRVEEIQGSMRTLSELLERQVRLFSYPFGAYDRACVVTVRAAGARGACTAGPGAVSASTDPFRLPRMHVGN